jgi:hypothetical protein
MRTSGTVYIDANGRGIIRGTSTYERFYVFVRMYVVFNSWDWRIWASPKFASSSASKESSIPSYRRRSRVRT